jgi:hypothetical protein
MRQVLRLEEPKEMSVLRRFASLGASQIRSTYGRTGLLEQEVFVPAELARKLGYDDVPQRGDFISLVDAENALLSKEEEDKCRRALARQEVRLPAARRRGSWSQVSDEDKRVLLMSQKEWNSFRAPPRGGGAAVETAAGPATPGPAPEETGSQGTH